MDKTAEELGQILADMYNNAPPKKLVVMIHLFGIQYSEEVRKAGLKEVVAAAGLSHHLQAELNKGVNLGEYVIVRDPWKSRS
ncbi:HTH-like domain-containing protein [Arsenicibacter rosenii]|nr:hypothetical protein [Arsenicibacter rosenii]